MIQELIVLIIVTVCIIISIKRIVKSVKSGHKYNCSSDICPHCKNANEKCKKSVFKKGTNNNRIFI